MPRLPFKTFASRLSFYILVLTIGIFICLAIFFDNYTARRANNHAVLYSSALLQTILDDTELEMKDVEHIVYVIKSQVEDNIENPNAMSKYLIDMVNKENLIMGGCVAFEPGFYPSERRLFMEYVYLDETSGQLITKHLDGEAYDYLHMEWYTSARDEQNPIWSEPYNDEGGGNRLMTTYSVPLIDDNGHVYGVLTADVSIEELVDCVNDMRPYKDGYTFIINANGKYIAHPDSTVLLYDDIFTRAKAINSPDLAEIGRKMMEHKAGNTDVKVDGEKLHVCYAPLESTGWSACYVCPYQSILDSMGDVMLYVYIALFFWLLMLVFLIHRIILRQTKPMEALTAAAYQMSSGNLDVPLPDIRSNDELAKLHDGFSYMQSSLKQYIEQLTDATRTKERIASELSIAHDIQMSLVPKNFNSDGNSNIDIHALLTPAKEVGGDFYDYLLRDDKLYFTIGDVSGKGVPAALIMAITRSRFRLFCENCSSPSEIIAGLNHALCQENEAFMFVTMFVGILDMNSGTLTYCNAGHNPAVIFDKASCRFMDVVPNLPIGIDENIQYIEQSCMLVAGTSLLLYTDGLVEAEKSNHEQYGERLMLDNLAKLADANASTVVKELQNSVDKFIDGAEPSDDLTLLCIRYTKPSETLSMTNSLSELDRLHDFLEALGEKHGASSAFVNSVNLALEEAVVNVINYAYPEGASGEIQLNATCHEGTMTFTLTDYGTPFDPTAAPEADTTSALEDRQIGGLGILLIRNIMDSVRYQRADNANHLTMSIKIK